MGFQLSAGIVTTERDLSTVVPAVATTPGAFAGIFQWGPVEEITLIDTENNLVDTFGEPDSNTYKSFFTAANFLAYGGNLNIVRVVGSSAVNAVPSGTPTVAGGNSSSSSSSVTNSSSSSSSQTVSSSSSSESSSSVTNSSSSSQSISSSSSAGNDAILVKNRDHYDTLSGLKQVVIARYPGATGNSLYVSMADSESFNGWAVTIDGDSYDLEAQFDVAPGTSDYVSERGGSNDELHIIVLDKDGEITGTKGTVLEKFSFVSKCNVAKKADGTNNYYKDVLNDSSEYIWWAGHPVGGTNWGGAATLTFTTLDNPVAYNLSGGDDNNGSISNSNYQTGYALFADIESSDIALVLGGNASTTVAQYIIDNVVESRQDCVAFISPEETDVVNVSSNATQYANILDFKTTQLNRNSSYYVCDSGWKKQYDRYNDTFRWIPLNGDIAGLCARADRTNDPWYSPGGLNRGQIKNVVKLAFNPTKSQRDGLYKISINPVISKKGQGNVLWGDRTGTTKPSAFREIGIRRLFITLRKAITVAAEYALFEFNDEYTRSQFKGMVEPYLRDVQGRRGMVQFSVVCDSTNNPQSVINRQEFVGDIYILPNHSINFITLSFIATRDTVQFNEVSGG